MKYSEASLSKKIAFHPHALLLFLILFGLSPALHISAQSCCDDATHKDFNPKTLQLSLKLHYRSAFDFIFFELAFEYPRSSENY